MKKGLKNKMKKESSCFSDDEKYNFLGKKDSKYDHEFVVAVTTTKIFCLPSCSARTPNRENVIFYDTKKEAIKKGFRTCKRCKP